MRINYDRRWYCTQCGNQIPYIIPRREGKMHKLSHLKKLWCPHCNKEINAVETSEFSTHYSYSDFLFEFKNGNFNADGTRIMEYGPFRDYMYKKGVELP